MAGTTTTLTSSVEPARFGQTVAFTATVTKTPPVPGNPTGTVTFTVDSVPLLTAALNAAGQASASTSSLSVNTHTVVATYSGDSNFTSSTSAPLRQNVDPAGTATTLASSPSPATQGQPVTFTATVTKTSTAPGNPTGSVTFSFADGSALTATLTAGGQATVTTSSLSSGTHNVVATYHGDLNFATSSSAVLTQAVTQGTTTTTFSATANPSVCCGPVTYTATVSPVPPATGVPTGTVTLTLTGGPTLPPATLNAAGQATFTVTGLQPGSYPATAAYNGSASFAGSTSATVTQTVNRASSATTLTTTPNPSTVGQTVTLTATVQPTAPATCTPTGTVSFIISSDGPVLTGTLNAAGQTSVTISSLSTGPHSVVASYPGSTCFKNSTAVPVTQTVTP